jgi:pimeloyl-ACP methyl ester carboxylesterase
MIISKDIYPFEGSYLNLNGLRLHYLDEGEGDPVVMVHGNPTWSIYYRNLVNALRGSYRTVVPDHMGCGLSDKPDDAHYDSPLAQRVDDLEALLSHLKINEKITLILHDWGGMIGMGYAAPHPESIHRLVLLNTSAFHKPVGKPFPWLLWLCRNTGIGAFLIYKLNAFSRTAARICCKRNPMPREIREAYISPYEENSIATLRFVQDIPLKSGDRSFDTVTEIQEKLSLFRKVPVLVCWGEKDFVFDKHFLKEWIRIFPQAEVHRFPDCGHYVLEDATEEIADLVQDFLANHPI